MSRKHPAPWRAEFVKLRLGNTVFVEVYDANGDAVLPWTTFDGMKKTPAMALARRIVAGVNSREPKT